MKHILFINPPIPDFIKNKDFQLPLSLMYLSHYLESTLTAGTHILDFNVKNYETIDLGHWLRSFDYVGINCFFSGSFPFVDNLARRIKTIRPDIKIVIGGIHPTIFKKQILENCPHIDFVIEGEGELSLRELILTGNSPHYRSPPNDLDNFSIWSALRHINLDDYRHDLSGWVNPRGLKFDISIPIITTRGCPNKCNFCSVFRATGRILRTRSSAAVVNELELYYNNYGCNRFSFYDDNILVKKGHMENICKKIIDRGLNIQWETATGLQLNKLTEEKVDLMVKAGWVRSMIPVESGNDYIRNKIIKKDLSKEHIYSITSYIKNKYPFVLQRALFIVGMPEETNESLQETYDMIKTLNVDECRICPLVVLPGTAVFDQCVRDSLFVDKIDLENYWRFDRTDIGDSRDGRLFAIKPYNMTLDELELWCTRLNDLISEKELDNLYRKI